MAGGIGSRFWPMSTPEYPKQFMDVLGTGRTMIQMTYDRFVPVCPPENVWVVTSARYVGFVREQLPLVPESNILAEPAARSTAPCIAYACWKIRAKVGAGNANVVVTPSDALVLDPVEYRRVIGKALAFTGTSDAIVTVGIKPTRPETGYGYIETGSAASDEVCKVSSFKEKPCREVAVKYYLSGDYLWNAGIFVWNLDTICNAMRSFAPSIARIADEMAVQGFSEEAVARLFPLCEKISIDYAVMEKSPSIYTIPGNFGWSDLGTWGSVRLNASRDDNDNAVIGDNVHLYGCSGCVVHISDLAVADIQGLQDCIVAEKDGRLLICRLEDEQMIKDFEK